MRAIPQHVAAPSLSAGATTTPERRQIAGLDRRALIWAVSLALGMRFALGVVAALSLALRPRLNTPATSLQLSGLAPAPGSWQDVVAGPWQRWDALEINSIALHGYDARSAVFAPLMPGLEALLGRVTGGVAVAGVLISTVALIAAFYLLHRLVSADVAQPVAERTLLLIAAFPTAVFFIANYSESLFLALSVGAFLCARRGRLIAAGGLASLAVLCRYQELFLVLPLAVEAWGQARRRREAGDRMVSRDQLALLLPPLVLAAWFADVTLVIGVPGGPPGSESRLWGDHLVPPWTVAVHDLQRIFAAHSVGSKLELSELLLAAAGAAGVALMWRRLPASYTVYAAISVLAMVSREVHGVPAAISRFTLVVFPLFVIAVLLLRWRLLFGAVVTTSALGLVVATDHFVHWGYLG